MTQAITPEQAQQILDEADLIYGQQEIEKAYERLSIEISAVIANKNPLVVCILNGGLVPSGGLITRFSFPMQLDYLHASRYRGATTGSELVWIARTQHKLKDRVVLLVDDILDEGHTLDAIIKDCYINGAQQVYSAVLLEKKLDYDKAIQADFVGLEIENRYVFGCGMDYKEYHRNLPGVYAVRDEVIKNA